MDNDDGGLRRQLDKVSANTETRLTVVEKETERLSSVISEHGKILNDIGLSQTTIMSTLMKQTITLSDQTQTLVRIDRALVKDAFDPNDDGLVGQQRSLRLDLKVCKDRLDALELSKKGVQDRIWQVVSMPLGTVLGGLAVAAASRWIH
jgi:hypothetical protein